MTQTMLCLLVMAELCGCFPCAWPPLHTTGRVAHVQTRAAQRLLNLALSDDLVISGVYGEQTTEAAKDFQKKHGLPVDGEIGPSTWPLLVDVPTPPPPQAVSAVQDLLASYGYTVTVDGVYSAATIKALGEFQVSRGVPHPDGKVVDPYSWHLLVSGCNSSLSTEAYWFDAGWPQGVMNTSVLTCLRNSRFHMAIFECWRQKIGWWSECVGNIKRSKAVGFQSVNAYMFPQRFADPSVQVEQLLSNLTANSITVELVMLDIEGGDWAQHTQEENRDFLSGLKAAFQQKGQRIAVYCGPGWTSYFGDNFTSFSDVPLVYAHYDNVPSFYDYTSYGGWKEPAGKQFWDGEKNERLCSSGALDWNWSPRPFWST